MTLGEELRTKYGLTSVKAKGGSLALLAISEALETAAEVAEHEHSSKIAARIRSLKWADRSVTPMSVPADVPLARIA